MISLDAKNDNLFKEAIFVLFHDIVLFKRIVVLVCLVTLAVAFFVPPTYDIGGEILVESKQIAALPSAVAPAQGGGGTMQNLPATPQDVATELNLLLSRQFFQFAARRMQEEGVLPAEANDPLSRAKRAIKQGVEAAMKKVEDLAPWLREAQTPPPRVAIRPLRTAGTMQDEEAWPSRPQSGPFVPDKDDTLWKDLMEAVGAEQLPGTNLIQLSFFTKRPLEDLAPARLFMESFLLFRQNQDTGGESSFYSARLREYERQFSELERRKVDLLRDTELAGDVNQEIERLTGKINTLDDELQQLRDNHRTARVWLNYIQDVSRVLAMQKKDLNLMPPFPLAFESSDLREINMRLFDMIVEYIRLSSTFTEQFNQSANARQNLKSMERYIQTMCENEVGLRQTQVGIMAAQIADKEKLRQTTMTQLQRLKQIAPELAILNAKATALQTFIQTFINRAEEQRLQNAAGSTLQLPSVRISAGPAIPKNAAFPRKRIVLPAGLVGGVLLALLVVFTRHMLSRNFATPRDVRNVLGLPTLAAIEEQGVEPPTLSVLWRLDDAFPGPVSWLRRAGLFSGKKRKRGRRGRRA